jgi:hypothetical protein
VAAKKVPARKVPAPLTAAERSFVEAPKRSAPPKDKRPSPKALSPSGPLSTRSTVERADGRTLRRIQLYFELAVAKRLRHHCVEHELDMSQFVNAAVKKALG